MKVQCYHTQGRGEQDNNRASASSLTDLLWPSCDEHPKGLAEEGGEEGVEGRWALQEGVHLVQQSRVRRQLLIDLRSRFCFIFVEKTGFSTT